PVRTCWPASPTPSRITTASGFRGATSPSPPQQLHYPAFHRHHSRQQQQLGAGQCQHLVGLRQYRNARTGDVRPHRRRSRHTRGLPPQAARLISFFVPGSSLWSADPRRRRILTAGVFYSANIKSIDTWKSNLRVVLVSTRNPLNIGASA